MSAPAPMPPSVQTVTCPSCEKVVSYTTDYGTTTTCVLHTVAQELLEALEGMLIPWATARQEGDAMNKARAAIAKARP